ncbi:amidohydrolase [Qipengyuania oceanensis]|uniref:Amidohydrolase family protein n=1 Tax=Qipengyuania oceanensis TaxID=1463597 RepID=A0A844YE24_9SPHN|nr:amidohydrolase [Qipengyuania oceanensis]MXO62411.1 amidohydrolase family protein [Qipengyuania oceanensis]
MIRTALALGLAGFATAAHADVLIDNVSGITIGEDGEIDRFTGLWIDDDGRIKQVLDKGDRRPAKTDFRYDGEGRTVIPGMIDAHAHVMGLGIAELTLDLSNTRSLDDALAEIARFARENPSRPWILGRGWNQEQWGLGRFPTAAELDRAVADRPVYLERVDGHAGWANSEAIKRAGVTAATKDPEGGRIERIAGSKTPSGVFVDLASELFIPVIPAPRPAERDLALMEAQEKLLSNGITAVADMGTTMADWLTFRRVADRGNLKVRIMSYASDPETMEMIGGAGERPWLYGDRLRMNGLKIYLDGALGSRGAWLKRPYADDPGNTGLPLIEPTRFRNVLSRAALGGYQVAIHAIGDAANGEALAAMAELKESFPGDTRWRIEHAQIVDPADLPAFGANGIIASMQPVHQTSDRLMAESRLDPARLEGAYAWRTVLDTGGKLAFGSDAPVESPNPFAGLAAAISRTGADGQPEGGWYPQQAVSRKEALAGFTSDAAYAGFAEGRFGKLVAGERADFVIVDRDPLAANPQDLRQTRVIQVWMDGEPVWGYTAK